MSGDIGDYDVIIGMDIITLGDFVITNKDDQTWFAFVILLFSIWSFKMI